MTILKSILLISMNLAFLSKDFSDDQKVILCSKNLKSIPKGVLKNKDLRYLDLGTCEVVFYPPLSAITPENANQIKKIPDEIGDLSNLEVLILNTNKIATLPESIIKLDKLKILDLSINKDFSVLNEIDKISQLKSLKILKVVDTQITKKEMIIIKSKLKTDVQVIVTVKDYFESSKDTY